MYVCMYECVLMCVYKCMGMYECECECIYVNVCVCLCVCVCVYECMSLCVLVLGLGIRQEGTVLKDMFDKPGILFYKTLVISSQGLMNARLGLNVELSTASSKLGL